MARDVTATAGGGDPGEELRPANWWTESEDGKRILCGVCPRACSLGPGDRGFCFVRENRQGHMVLSTYGRSTGFCIDPIEKKPLNHFYPGTAVLSFGTAGCNLGCQFCQNWSMSRNRDVDAGCQQATPETIARAAQELQCRSVAFTYNDPIIWAEYAIDTARACHQRDIKTVAVTSGYIAAEARTAFYEHMDAANVDLKGFSDDFYRRFCGGHLDPVLDTLRWLAHHTKVWLEITNLVIPRANDSPEELRRMCDWIVAELGPDVPLHFSAFHPDFKMLDRSSTPPETLAAAYEIGRQAGLRYVYTGNISDRARQCTYCPGCGHMVIERTGYMLGEFAIADNCCRHCQTPIAGRFESQPGTWGGRRVPVDISQYAAANERAPARPVPSLAVAEPAAESVEVPSAVDKPRLTPEDESLVFQAAGRRVTAAVFGYLSAPMADVLGNLATTPLYGAFVSLKRAQQLRSCCGFLGASIPLAEALDHAAIRAAKEDPRFPPISPSELGHLDMEVWLLWGLQPIAARGEDRIAAITIGKHGLQIARGQARGLLLPGVAVEHKLDARGFLRQVCLKAGLAEDAWRYDDTLLMTFEGHAIRGRLEAEGSDEAAMPGGPTSAELTALLDFCRQNILALLYGATPTFYLPSGFDGAVSGIALAVGPAGGDRSLDVSKLALRPELPLQSTLFQLTEAAARSLQARRFDAHAMRTQPLGLTILWDPALHGTVAAPELNGIDPHRRAVWVLHAGGNAWVYDPQKSAGELLAQAAADAEVRSAEQSQVFSLAVASTQPRAAMAHVLRPQAGPEQRPAAKAGMFYPRTPDEIGRALQDMFVEPRGDEVWPAALVPHAGWVYSGRLAAKVLNRLQIPDQVIVLCPNHTRLGAPWAVTPHETWLLPCCHVAADPDLARRLAAGIGGLQLDAAAHQQEHAIEVQLPLLHRLAPDVRVVGITIGGGDLPALKRFGQQLAEVLRTIVPQPLLVVSSDMNHYADETQTRRFDQMAIEALESLDPDRVYETIRQNKISMCGFMPAVIVLEALRQLGQLTRCELVGHTTSAEASGDTSRVVGYAGMLFG